ncbi:MAG: DUF177 domain-containing protein [Muribaculaceae bacterium]|nr:DUF177 domain-containing protein [Muribaculaceae bacterium]
MGKFTAYKVQLASLPEGHHEQDFVCDTAFFKNMENGDVVNCNVDVHLDLEHHRGLYDLKFTFKGLVQVPCDRCLDPIDIDVDTTYNIKVEYGDDYDDASDDLLIIPAENPYLNVAYMLYDTILLSIPLRHVHPLGKCNRAMAAALNKHKVRGGEDDDTELVDTEIGLDEAEDISTED